MSTLIKILKSRTNWAIAAMFVIGGLNAIVDVVPQEAQLTIMGILAFLGIVFRTNPKQQFDR